MPLDADAVRHHASLQEPPDNAEQAIIANPPGKASHEDVVVHPVEEFFQVEVVWRGCNALFLKEVM